MASAITICSNALLMLGAKPIASLSDSDDDEVNSPLDRVRLCANLYPVERLAFLRQHTWSGAIKRVILSPETTAPAFGFQSRFLRPSDWLRTIQVGQYEGYIPPYRTEGGYFLVDEAIFYLTYVADVDESLWDSMMIDVMTRRMAAVLAYPITRDSGQEQLKQQEYAQKLQEAKSVDGQDDPPSTVGGSILINSRFGGTPWSGR
jgi:hypothetical protein